MLNLLVDTRSTNHQPHGGLQQMVEHAAVPATAADACAASVDASVQWGAYIALRERNFPSLLRYATKIVGDSDTARDQVERVLMKVVLGHTPLVRISWLYLRTSVRRECRRELRWRRRFQPFPHSFADTKPAGRNEFDRIDAILELNKYLTILPVKCAAIVLARMAGARNCDIAAQLGLSEKTVSAQLRRAKEIVRASQRGAGAAMAPTKERRVSSSKRKMKE